MRSVARRYQRLSEEISELDEQLDRLVAEAAPELVAVEGVGTDTAASLLIAAGDNPERLKSEAYSDAHLCGAAPIPASSGKSVRHRLNRRGNRDANRALYVITVCRMSREERTRRYVALGAPPRARPRRRSSAVSRGTSLARSTGSSPPCAYANPRFRCLDKHRSIT
jgi:transposase